MAGLLSGLDKLGLGSLKDMDLFEEPKKKEEKIVEVAEPAVVQEQDFLFDKTHNCPVCDANFKSKTVKIARARLHGTDMDLRPKYEQIDILKYDVIVCPECGYAALSRYFKFITSVQSKLIKQTISPSFKPPAESGDILTYEEALERYQLALANAIVKRARASEKAYICLKAAWLLRGWGESLDESGEGFAEKKKEIDTQENEFLQSALNGFISARQSEAFPMCGMDEHTVNYLIAVTAVRFEQYDIASKLVSTILTSTAANTRMKDKARDLKEILLEKIKEKNSTK